MTDVRHIVFSNKTHRKDANSNSSAFHRQVLGGRSCHRGVGARDGPRQLLPCQCEMILWSVTPSSFLSWVRRNERIFQLRFTACVTGCRGLLANSEILHTSEMSPHYPQHFITHFPLLSPADAIHSSVVSVVPKTTPQTQKQAVVRGQEGRMPSPRSTLACGLTSAVLFHMFLLPAMSHTSPAPPPPVLCPTFQRKWFLWLGVKEHQKVTQISTMMQWNWWYVLFLSHLGHEAHSTSSPTVLFPAFALLCGFSLSK